jgi:hypothetical protein
MMLYQGEGKELLRMYQQLIEVMGLLERVEFFSVKHTERLLRLRTYSDG